MNALFAIVRLATALALLQLALDWRSPAVASARSLVFVILIAGPLLLAALETWLWRARARSQLPAMLHAAIIAAAVFSTACTIFLEARFQWMRQQVLRADARELEHLGRHLIIGYRDPLELRNLIEKRAVSGIFLAAHNVRDRTIDEVKRDIQVLQAIRARQHLGPLWVATDQEGGPVSRLSPPLARSGSLADLVEATSEPIARAAAVEEFAANQARELSAIGINVNFAPVVDLNHHVVSRSDRYTRIYARAIAAEADVVAAVAARYCSVLWRAGIRCTLKHFPGLGRISEDTHLNEADLTASTDDLNATDWVPFRALMRDDNAFTMLGHARLTAVDPSRPTSFSHPVVSDMIRHAWRHDGVLITDDLCMGAVYLSRQGITGASVEALNAGVDLLLVSFDPDQYYPVMFALLQAYRAGRLRADVLEQSQNRLRRAMDVTTTESHPK